MPAPVYYRNKKKLFVGNADVDPDTLWEYRDGKLYLVDDDWHLESPLNDSFYKVEAP